MAAIAAAMAQDKGRNMKKTALKILLCAIAFGWSAHSFAIGQAWKVEDDATHRGLADIKMLLEAQMQTAGVIGGQMQKAATASSINYANMNAMGDLKRAEMAAAPNLQKCIAISRASGGGAVVANNARAVTSLREQMNIKQNTFGSGNFTNVIDYKGREELCSSADATNGICERAGALGGWGDKVDALRVNPTDKNFSLNDKQVGYGQHFITSMTYALAPDPEGGGRKGNTSDKYAALRKIWQQRMSPTLAAMNEQLAYSRGIRFNSDDPMAKVWNDPLMIKAYQEIRGKDSVRPTAPSLKDIDQMMVLRPMFYSGDIATRETTTATIDAVRRLEESQNLTNYLLMRMITEMQHINAQLGSINSNQLAPVSNDLNQSAATGK